MTRPIAQAPHSILLAVPPDTRARWDLPALEAVLQETLELAKLRAVDPAALAPDLDHGRSAAGLLRGLQSRRRHGVDRPVARGGALTKHSDTVRETVMASITSWMRLEPRTRSTTMQPGLQARVHDPLWLLARQWQLGEFQAQDAGSLVSARMRGDAARLSRYQPGRLTSASASVTGKPYDGTTPLEAVVERESLTAAAVHPGRAAEAGLHFIRLLKSNGVGHYRDAYRTAYPLAAGGAPDVDGARFLRVMSERGVDGGRLYNDLARALRPPIRDAGAAGGAFDCRRRRGRREAGGTRVARLVRPALQRASRGHQRVAPGADGVRLRRRRARLRGPGLDSPLPSIRATGSTGMTSITSRTRASAPPPTPRPPRWCAP